ncbi:hypothetical protein Tco_1161920, partial [Tanacetum coccineum]
SDLTPLHHGFTQLRGGKRNTGNRNGTYRRKENNNNMREYQQKNVMENNRQAQAKTLHDEIVDAIRKLPNKFVVLDENNERRELHMLKYRMIVDQFQNKKMRPSCVEIVQRI